MRIIFSVRPLPTVHAPATADSNEAAADREKDVCIKRFCLFLSKATPTTITSSRMIDAEAMSIGVTTTRTP